MHSVYRPSFHLVIPSVQSVHLSVHPSNCSVHSSINSVRLYICLFISFVPPSVHSVHPTMLSACIFICLSICPSVCLFGLSIHLSVCPSDNICRICLLVPPSIHLSIHPYYTSIQSVWSSICSVCLSVHSYSGHQSICHFKGHFHPTDRNDRTSEIIMNKYSSQTDYPSVCSPSIHSVHPSSWKFNLSLDLSIQSIRPSDGRSDVFFLFGK